MKAISSSRPNDAVTASLNGANGSAAASANATSAKASGALVCHTIVRRNGWRSPKARPTTMKRMRCATRAQTTAMSSTATPESQGGAQNNASRMEDSIDPPSAKECRCGPCQRAKTGAGRGAKICARAGRATGVRS